MLCDTWTRLVMAASLIMSKCPLARLHEQVCGRAIEQSIKYHSACTSVCINHPTRYMSERMHVVYYIPLKLKTSKVILCINRVINGETIKKSKQS